MSGTRFTRSGRCRLFISLGTLVLMFGMVAIFHSSQQQLDESRELRLRCEQQQEVLNARLQSIAEQKNKFEKSQEQEINHQLEAQKSLEQKIKAQHEMHSKETVEARVRQNKMQTSLKLLQIEVGECTKTKNLHLEEKNILEKKLELLLSDLQKEKKVQDNDILQWREKYNSLIHENERLEALLNDSEHKVMLKQHILELEQRVAEYKSHCNYKLMDNFDSQQQINKPLNSPETTRKPYISPRPGFDKPHNVKSFSEQELVSPDLYRIPIKITNTTFQTSSARSIITTKIKTTGAGVAINNKEEIALQNTDNLQLSIPFSARNHSSLIINSVENFQIAPKPIEKLLEETETERKQHDLNKMVTTKLSATLKRSTESTKIDQNIPDAVNNKENITNSSSSPLSVFLNKRKIPDYVAPIPANFEYLLQNDLKVVDKKLNNGGFSGDMNAAVEDTQKNDKNNRYANVVSDMEQKSKVDAVANEDSGAHEIKDRDFLNDQNLKLPLEEDNNFFDGVDKQDAAAESAESIKHKINRNVNDDDLLGAVVAGAEVRGDIDVKNRNNLLDANHLNNEVLADQGKEFPDELRLEDGNDEEEDEDDYLNPAARKLGAQAIRN